MAGGGSSSSQPVDMTPGAFKNLQGPFADIIGQLMGVSGQAANPNAIMGNIPGYTGPLAAPATANENTTLGQLQANANAPNANNSASSFLQTLLGQPAGQTASVAQAGQTASTVNAQMNGANAGNPFLQAAITAAQRPTMQNLTETLTRDLPGRFTQAGQFIQPQGSSAFDRAAAIATRGAGDTMGDIATNISANDYEAQQGRNATTINQQQAAQNTAAQQQNQNQVTAASLAPQVSGAQVDNLVKNLQAQALPRLINDYGLENGMAEFNNRTNSLLALIGMGAGVTAPQTSQASSSQTKPNLMPLIP